MSKSQSATKAETSSTPSSEFERVMNASKQDGNALPKRIAKRLEKTLGEDISSVRVHDDPVHHQLARSLNAKAFTVGTDIFFGEGRYRPGSQAGDRLLVHELTHVVQQLSGRVTAGTKQAGLNIGQSNDCHEQEADRVAEQVVAGREVDLPGTQRDGIYRSSGIAAANANLIQRDDEDEQGFDYNLLPPSLSYRRGPFGLSADTSAAQLSLYDDEGRVNMGYQYGGDIFYGANIGDFRTRFGVNPQSGVGSMSLGGSHSGFRWGLSGNTAGNFGLNLGYGAPLLPMPWQLGQQAGSAWSGVTSVGGAIPDFVSDPMGTYDAQRDNIGAISTFGRSMGQIYGQSGQGGLPFGAGLTLSYNPEQRWVLGAGIQGSF